MSALVMPWRGAALGGSIYDGNAGAMIVPCDPLGSVEPEIGSTLFAIFTQKRCIETRFDSIPKTSAAPPKRAQRRDTRSEPTRRSQRVAANNGRKIFFAREPAVREPALAVGVYIDARLPGDGNAGLRFARRHRSARHRQRS